MCDLQFYVASKWLPMEDHKFLRGGDSSDDLFDEYFLRILYNWIDLFEILCVGGEVPKEQKL